MKIVPFVTSRDLDLYLEGDVVAFKESFPGVTITTDLMRDIRSGILGITHNEDMAAFTALIDELPIGFVTISKQWFYDIPQGYVDSIFVKENYRNQGVGRQLLSTAESWAKEVGAYSIRLDVSLCNTTAITAYEKSGFVSTRVQMERAI
jgi:GNAT superfamily N-acetyltransferase